MVTIDDLMPAWIGLITEDGAELVSLHYRREHAAVQDWLVGWSEEVGGMALVMNRSMLFWGEGRISHIAMFTQSSGGEEFYRVLMDEAPFEMQGRAVIGARALRIALHDARLPKSAAR
jgi:hypothetical protein